jgi:hypothetical protein
MEEAPTAADQEGENGEVTTRARGGKWSATIVDAIAIRTTDSVAVFVGIDGIATAEDYQIGRILPQLGHRPIVR